MPVHEYPLPVGAKNIDPPIPTISRSSKDGSIPVIQLFAGDSFIGDVLEGQWVKGNDGVITGPFTVIVTSGQLELTGTAASPGGAPDIGWANRQVPFYMTQNAYIDVHMKVPAVSPSNEFEIAFFIRKEAASDDPQTDDDYIRVSLERYSTPSYRIQIDKEIDGSPTEIYAAAVVTNEEGTFRIKFRPDDSKIDIYYHDGAGAIVEATDELTLIDDTLDLTFDIGYPCFQMWTRDAVSRTLISEKVEVSYPDLSIAYDQDAADIGKGDVKVYDTMGSATETDWRRIYDESHDFTGDCVIENGLIRLIVDEAQQYGLELYYWTGSAWSQPFDVLRFETDPTTYNLDYPFLKDIVSINRNESVQLRVRMCNSATESDTIYGEFLVTLERGKYHIGFLGETLTPRLDTVVYFYEDGTPFRFGYVGETEVADADVTTGNQASSTTLTDNFMMIFDDAGAAVIGFIVTDTKPDGANKEFEALEISTDMAISIHSIAPDDFATTTTYIGIAPYPDNDHLFTEAESGTTTGTDDVSDGSASGGFKVELDAQDEYVYVTLTGVTDLPVGRYKMVVRANDTNQIADDLELYVYNQTDSRYMNEDRAESKLTSNAATWDFYSIIFEVVAADSGDTIRFYVNKGTATANTIDVDYFLLLPLSNGESMPQDMAHNAMREASVNFRLTDSATFQLFSGLGIAAQLAGSVYTDAMAINAIESATSIDLTGSFSASTIKTSADNEGIYVGAGDDLRLYHDGNDSYVQNSQGQLILKCIGDDVVIDGVDTFIDISGEFYIRDKGDGNVILAELDTVARTLQFGQAADKLTIDLYGDLTISDYLTIDTINHETTDVDKFLVSNAGVVKYRTGSELLIDIGAVGVPLALTDLASYVQGSIIIGGAADWEPLVAGTETYVLTMGADEPYWAVSAGGTDDDAIHDNVADEIHQITLKGTPVAADVIVIEDSVDTWNKKRIAISTLPAGSPSFGVPTGDIDIGDSAAEGSSGDATRADHQHAFSAPGAGYPVDVGATEADGTATTPARSDHVHAHGSGYSSDAHHAEAHALAVTGPHSGALPLIDIASYVQGSIIIGGGTDWEPLVAGTLNYVLKMGAAEPAWGQVDYSELVGSQPAPINHNLIDTTGHPVSGLTGGHFLKALTTTTYGFASHGLSASDVGAAPAFTETQWTLPVFDTTTTIGDSMVSQDATGDNLTIDGTIIVVNQGAGGDPQLYSNNALQRLGLTGEFLTSGKITIGAISAEGTDVNKFLVSNAGEIKYRTGAQVYSDIDGYVTADFTTDFAAESLANLGTRTHANLSDAPTDAHHNEIHALATSGPHSGSLPLTDLGSYVQGSIIIGGGADWEALLAGTNTYVLKMGAAEPAWGQVDYSELTGSQPAPIAHVLDSATHTITGKTAGQFLKADSPTTYSFQAHGLTASDVSAEPANANIQSHVASPVTDAHHAKFTGSEAVTAVVAENPLSLTYALKIGGNSIEDSTGAEMIGFDGAGLIDFLAGQGTPSDNDVLAWDIASSKWIVQAQVGAGGGVTGSGTQWTLPVWDDAGGTTIGDSMVSQNSAGTALTIAAGTVAMTGGLSGVTTLAMSGALTGLTSIANSTTITSQGAIYNDADNSGVYVGELAEGRLYHDGTDVYLSSAKSIILDSTAGGASIIAGVGGDVFLNSGANQQIYFRDGSTIKITFDFNTEEAIFSIPLNTRDITPFTNNTETIGTSTSDKYLEMFATTFNTGDIVFGNEFVISEVERPDWDGEWNAPYEEIFAFKKEDGATPGLIFYNNRNEPIALLDEDGEFHVKGKIHEYSDVFKAMKKLRPRIKKGDTE